MPLDLAHRQPTRTRTGILSSKPSNLRWPCARAAARMSRCGPGKNGLELARDVRAWSSVAFEFVPVAAAAHEVQGAAKACPDEQWAIEEEVERRDEHEPKGLEMRYERPVRSSTRTAMLLRIPVAVQMIARVRRNTRLPRWKFRG